MSDSFTLEHLRTLIAVHEAGNFSAAGRKLKRAQSAVSATMANPEEQLGRTLYRSWTGNDMDTYADDLHALVEALDLRDTVRSRPVP